MELKLKPSKNNPYPLLAILIKGEKIDVWLRELQHLHINIQQVRIYALPAIQLNSVYGCLVVLQDKIEVDIRNNIWCQQIGESFFIPQYCDVYPKLLAGEIGKLFSQPHLLHTSLGLVELDTLVDFGMYINIGTAKETKQIRPKAIPFVPSKISTFRVSIVQRDELDELLDDLEKSANIDQLKDKPLSTAEKLRLSIYKKLSNNVEPQDIEARSMPKGLQIVRNITSIFKGKDATNHWMNDKLEDYDELNRRSQDQLEKLLKMLKDDPERALDYAIPLDENGTSRGGELGSLALTKLLKNLSSLSAVMQNRSHSSGGGYVSLEDQALNALREQYRQSAEQLVKEKKYLKASYVYIKLLKDNWSAIRMFEKAELYKEAGDVCHKLAGDDVRAGEYYEKAGAYKEAIKMYEPRKQYEKVGDLYMKLYDREHALIFYQKEADRYVDDHMYIKAAEIFQQKMNKIDQAQMILLKGWTENIDPYNCLGKYLSNIEDESHKCEEIKSIYEDNIEKIHPRYFLHILKNEYVKGGKLGVVTKEIAYQIISNTLPKDRQIAKELIAFNNGDQQLVKDTIRYSTLRK